MTGTAVPVRRTRLAAYAVSITDGTVLLARIARGYPGEGRWTLPGGGVEWGEHPDETLVRELHEETGFAVTRFSFLGINSRVYAAARHHAGKRDLVLLVVDPASLAAALKWEPSRGGALFPHLHAPLPVNAVDPLGGTPPAPCAVCSAVPSLARRTIVTTAFICSPFWLRISALHS